MTPLPMIHRDEVIDEKLVFPSISCRMNYLCYLFVIIPIGSGAKKAHQNSVFAVVFNTDFFLNLRKICKRRKIVIIEIINV
jgi:hypothetical protein